jgi:hypothetical protein
MHNVYASDRKIKPFVGFSNRKEMPDVYPASFDSAKMDKGNGVAWSTGDPKQESRSNEEQVSWVDGNK